MNHGNVYKILRWFLWVFFVVWFLTKTLLDPKSVNANLRSFLLDEKDWDKKQPKKSFYLPILGGSIFLLLSAIVVIIKTWRSSPNTLPGKYKNPLRNLNVIIAMVILVFTLLLLVLPDSLGQDLQNPCYIVVMFSILACTFIIFISLFLGVSQVARA